MPRVIIAANAADHPIAQALTAELQNYISSVAMLAADEPRTARQSVATAAAMVIVAGVGWLERIQQNPVLHTAIAQALNRSDMLIHVALLPDSTMPAVTELPDDLRSLAYMQTSPIDPDQHLERDARRLGLRLAGHVNRDSPPSQPVEKRDTPTSAQANQGLPWHIMIIVTAVATGLLFIIIPNLRGDRETGSTTIQVDTAPMSSAQNAAIITPRDGLMIGVAAGLRGPLADEGQAMVNGVRMAVMDRGEVTVDGQTFSIDLLAQDAGCTPEGGIQAAETFTTALTAIPGIIGHMCNVSCFPASGIYDESNLVTVSPACDAPGLTAFAGFNRTVPSQAAGAQTLAEMLPAAMGVERVVVISDEEVLGTQLADAFAAAFDAAGGTIAARFDVSSRTLDPAALAADVAAAEPDLVFLGGRVPAAVQIYTAITEAAPEAQFMLADTVDTAAFIAEAGTVAEGVLTYRPLAPANDNISALTERYTTIYETTPADDTLIHAYAYDATNMLLNGVEAVGQVDVVGNLLVDRVVLREYLQRYSGNGIIGTYACDGSGDCITVEIQLLSIQNGTLDQFTP